MGRVRIASLSSRNREDLKTWVRLRGFFLELNQTLGKEKDEILELYLNIAPYGGNIRGVEAAARRYLGKSAKELSLAESALIAGLPQSPERLRPDRFLKASLARRSTALRRMFEEGMITEEMRMEADSQPVELRRDRVAALGGHFAALALQRRPWGGVTTLDPDVQFEVEWLSGQHLYRLPGRTQVAVVVIEIETGGVAGMLGSRDFHDWRDGQINGALIWRSPGGVLNPFVYASAFEGARANLAVVYPGTERSGGGAPKAEALKFSLGIPAIHVARAIGTRQCANFIEGLGLRWRCERLGVGGVFPACGEIRLLDLANAFATVGRGGEWAEPRFFVDEVSETRRSLSAPMCAALDEVYSSHGNRPVALASRDASEVPWFMWTTGLSPDRRNAWAVGHNRRYAIGVWMGRFSGPAYGDKLDQKAAEPLLVRLFDMPGLQPDVDQPQGRELTGVRPMAVEPISRH